MMPLKQLFTDVWSLLFPNLCNACNIGLVNGEKAICLHCLNSLPYTDFHLNPNNPLAKQLWLRFPFNAAMAMLYFKKGGKVQQLIHNLKYQGKTEVGHFLGKLLAQRLIQQPAYQHIDCIIPIPLHKKKEKQRGYNQCQYIAEGIAEVSQQKIMLNNLVRQQITDTQTRKSRFKRYENMTQAFQVLQPKALHHRNVLLIDDVMTTGATIEACAQVLWQSNIKSLNIACLAYAK